MRGGEAGHIFIFLTVLLLSLLLLPKLLESDDIFRLLLIDEPVDLLLDLTLDLSLVDLE